MHNLYAVISLLLVSSVLARQFTVKNDCAFTIWPGMYTDLNVGTAVPDHETGWEAPARSEVSFTVPDNWKAGRIWGRTGCDFTTDPGPSSCETGGCNGGFECDPHTGTGVPPATVAEWTLSGDGGADWYDVSLVDGYNLPMSIVPSGHCTVADCPADLNPDCPAELAGPAAKDGLNAGCKSACFANLDGTPGDSANCCSGSHSTPETCPQSGIKFYDYFKKGCPNSYTYAYDESSGTALWTCPVSNKADYVLTFCPSKGK